MCDDLFLGMPVKVSGVVPETPIFLTFENATITKVTLQPISPEMQSLPGYQPATYILSVSFLQE